MYLPSLGREGMKEGREGQKERGGEGVGRRGTEGDGRGGKGGKRRGDLRWSSVCSSL